jgi:hypothetical protein
LRDAPIGKQNIQVNPTQFIEFDADRPGFVSSFNFRVNLRRTGRYLDVSSLLSNSAKTGLVKVIDRTTLPIGEDEENALPEVPIAPDDNVQLPIAHGKRSVFSKKTLTSLELAATICVFVVTLVIIIQCFICPHGKRRGKVDDSEERLLQGYPPGMMAPVQGYGMPYGYAPQYYAPPMAAYGIPYPIQPTGAYFPMTPTQEEQNQQ